VGLFSKGGGGEVLLSARGFRSGGFSLHDKRKNEKEAFSVRSVRVVRAAKQKHIQLLERILRTNTSLSAGCLHLTCMQFWYP
jgi:hypothetical protein